MLIRDTGRSGHLARNESSPSAIEKEDPQDMEGHAGP